MGVNIWWYESRSCWCADVPTERGRKRLYLGPDEAKAHAALYRYMAQFYEQLSLDDVDSKAASRPGSNSPSLLALAVEFLKWNQANRSEGTWRSYRDGLKHITRRYREKLAAELTVRDVERVKNEMIKEGYAARTINIMVTAIKRLYNWAVRQEILSENPLDGLEHVGKHVNAPAHPERKHLRIEHAIECMEACRASRPLGDICEMLLLTGMRVGELVRLRWQDVDFEQQIVRMERHKTSGTTDRPRTIPLCGRAIEILKAQATEDLEAEAPVFRGQDGQAFTVGALHLRLRRLRKKHPVLKGFSFHKLRHTCATYLARLKVPERVAQAILGHSSTLMTRYYTATDKDEMIGAVERLSHAIEGNHREGAP